MTNEEFQLLMLSEMKKIHQRFDSIDTKFEAMESRLGTIESRLDAVESQQRENTGFIQALLHQVEELNAKYDGLLSITVSTESFAKLEKKIDIIAYRVIDHDNDLSLLKRAK